MGRFSAKPIKAILGRTEMALKKTPAIKQIAQAFLEKVRRLVCVREPESVMTGCATSTSRKWFLLESCVST